MRELYIYELSLISGGNGLRASMETIAKDSGTAAVIGGTLGSAIINNAAAGARWGGGMGVAGSAGYELDSFLYNNSETVRETAIGMVESLHLRYADQSGNDYGDGTSY